MKIKFFTILKNIDNFYLFSRLYENYFNKINKKLSKKIINIPFSTSKFKGLNTFSRMLEK